MPKPGGIQAELKFLRESEPVTWPYCAIFWSVKWNRKKKKKTVPVLFCLSVDDS